MREITTASVSFQVFLLFLTLCANLIHAGIVTNPLPATQNRNASSLSAGEEATGLRQGHQETSGDYDVSGRRRCPLCDSSVLPYCGEKLFHDACCCTNPYQYPLPYKCRFADCAFLHANSCREHLLISNCCCTDDYRSLLRGLVLPDPAAAPDTTTVKN